ncbi:tetraspanin-18-like isoform X1 [Haliotis rufescens]|uniref:tetraspanin-18-like isoform X1 n=1 Tax=Haliotis rufescens TaxID=6454 RepID=UPI00201F9B48|nr:tetraspanin-18-like isoform X1 [Haliotis rufescens]
MKVNEMKITNETDADGHPKSGASLLGRPPSRKKVVRKPLCWRPPSGDNQYDGCCTNCLRLSLIFYMLYLVAVGYIFLRKGVWLLITDSKTDPHLDNPIQVAAYFIIMAGVAVVLLAFCGCCGAIRQNRSVLSGFGSVLLIVSILLCVVSGIWFTYRHMLIPYFMDFMHNGLKNQYGMDTESNPENSVVTSLWDLVQQELNCCGISDNSSSEQNRSWEFYTTNTQWYLEMQNDSLSQQKVPHSCCDPEGDMAVCTGQAYFPGPPNYLNSSIGNFNQTNPYLFTNDCYDLLSSFLFILPAFAAMGFVIAVLGIILTFCFRARVSVTSSPGVVIAV